MGGLSEKANSFSKIRRNTGGRLIAVDSGNALFKRTGRYPAESSQYINASAFAQIYGLLGLDAVAVGPADLSGGLDLLRETGQQGVPWVSANLFDDGGERVFPAFITTKVDTLAIAIVGITGPPATAPVDFDIRDAAEALARLIPSLDDDFDLIILLSATSIADSTRFTEIFPQIDIVVTADDTRKNVAPFRSGPSLLMQTGGRGEYQGVLSVAWKGGPLERSITSELLELRSRGKSITERIEQLQKSPMDADYRRKRIARLKNNLSEMEKRIDELEKLPASDITDNHASTYEFRFLPLAYTGRSDPQIDYIIREAQKRISALVAK